MWASCHSDKQIFPDVSQGLGLLLVRPTFSGPNLPFPLIPTGNNFPIIPLGEHWASDMVFAISAVRITGDKLIKQRVHPLHLVEAP